MKNVIKIITSQRCRLATPNTTRNVVGWLWEEKQKYNWDEMWHNIELARSFKGKHGNLSQMIVEDRENH